MGTPRKQDPQLKSYVAPAIISAAVGLLLNLIAYAITSPVSRLESLEKDFRTMQVAEAARSEQLKSLKETLIELKAGQTLGNAKLDDLKSEVIGLRRK